MTCSREMVQQEETYLPAFALFTSVCKRISSQSLLVPVMVFSNVMLQIVATWCVVYVLQHFTIFYNHTLLCPIVTATWNHLDLPSDPGAASRLAVAEPRAEHPLAPGIQEITLYSMQSFEIIMKLSLKNTIIRHMAILILSKFYQHQHGEVIICLHASGSFGLDPVSLWMLDLLISCSFALFEQLEAKPVAELPPWATLACRNLTEIAAVSLQGVWF